MFRYENGRLDAEELDTDGDGRLDRFDRFDADGRVALREEDLDGDGAIDVRSRYESGRLVRREFSRPELCCRSPEPRYSAVTYAAVMPPSTRKVAPFT